MASINREQMDVLVSLQEIQTESNRIIRFLSGVDRQKEELDNQVGQFKVEVGGFEKIYSDCKKEYSGLELELAVLAERIEKSEKALKVVQTNKEYQVLLREIDENKKTVSKIEDRLIELMEELEAKEKEFQVRKNDLSLLESKIDSEKEEIDKNCNTDRQKLAEFEQELDKIGKTLDGKLLNLFKQIAGKSGGVAVVEVVDSVCTACNINIPPQMFIELQRCEVLHFCPQCQRIIYWREPAGTDETV